MTLTFFSNFLNHHQLPLCLELRALLGDGFRFVATTPFNQGAVSKGYRDMNMDYAFCLPAYADGASKAEARRLGVASDVVLSGGVDDEWIASRFEEKKLTFRVTERPLKPLYARLDARTFAAMWWRNTRYKKLPLYLLACGAHTVEDFRRVGAYKAKAFKWGYFPPVPQVYTRPGGEKGAPLRLMWAGRMISWKKPEMPLRLAAALRDHGLPFELCYVGEGELLDAVKAEAAAMGFGGAVRFAGALPAAQVREEMLRSDIFLFTSDDNEGWGAVLNEAMASGCAVIASELAGSSGYLVRDGENGILFDGTPGGLVEKGMYLAAKPRLREELGVAAYDTLRRLWNGEVAAQRLVALCEGLLGGPLPLYGDGPCSLA